MVSLVGGSTGGGSVGDTPTCDRWFSREDVAGTEGININNPQC